MCRKPVIAVLLGLVCNLNAAAYAGSPGIVNYDVEMKILAQRNAAQMRARCTIRNDGAAELTQLVFDLLAREERCKACTQVQRIWQQVSGNHIMQTLTGLNLRTHEQWRKWWQGTRENFQPAQRARQLGPGGLTHTG